MYQWLKLYSCLPHIIHVYRCAHLLLQIPSIAQCVLCKVYFSAQLNKLRPILEFKKYYPIEHTYIRPSLFECAENTLIQVLVIFKL